MSKRVDRIFGEKQLKEIIDAKIANVTTEADMRGLVNQINDFIIRKNRDVKPEDKIPLLDEKYVMRRFNDIISETNIKKFRVEHDCKNCLFFLKPQKCKGMYICLLETDKRQELFENTKKENKCRYDMNGDCPYANKDSKCIGVCWKKIMEEHRLRMRELKRM